MASLALLASIVFLFILFIGPITYLLAKIGLPSFFIWILAICSIMAGFWLTMTLPHIFYIGFIPIYFGYISITATRKKY